MTLSTKLMAAYYANPDAPGYCRNPSCTKNRNKQYTERGYIMHMKADPWCCRFALHGCNGTIHNMRVMSPALMISDTSKKPTNSPAKEPPIHKKCNIVNMCVIIASVPPPPSSDIPALIGDDISALTDIEYEEVIPIPAPGFHCPNPNCPKSKTKRYSGRGYEMHLKASVSCHDYFLVALWHDYNLVVEEVGEDKVKEEDSSIMMTTPIRDDVSALTDVQYEPADDGDPIPNISCPNPNCPESKTKRFNHGDFPLLHMEESTSCVNFILHVVHSRLPPEMSNTSTTRP